MNQPEMLDVGNRVRTVRQERGLSLRALAGRCDLSPNAISLIERSISSPSISTLHRIAQGLGVPITSLLTKPTGGAKLILTRRDERERSGSASVLLEKLASGLEQQTLASFAVTLKAGAGSGKWIMAHSGHELVFCLKGELEYSIDGKAYLSWPKNAIRTRNSCFSATNPFG